MKTMRLMAVVSVLALSVFTNTAFAEESAQAGNAPAQGFGGGQGQQGKMNPMMMHQDSLIATSDGGIVVKSGPRLLKYDKDLRLIKEVELPRGKGPGQQKSSEGETSGVFPPAQPSGQ